MKSGMYFNLKPIDVPVIDFPGKPITSYKVNIVTDGTDNGTAEEVIRANYSELNYFVKEDSNIIDREYTYEWTIEETKFHLTPANINVPIYNHMLSGYVHQDSNERENFFLTNIEDDTVKFTLDKTKDKPNVITVDKNN